MSKRRVCTHFLANRCRFGANCKFSHDTSGDISPPAPLDPLQTWRLNIPRPGTHPRPISFAKFFQQGYELVQRDHATTQDIITSLASEGGATRIKDLLEQRQKFSKTSGTNFFREELLPFFRIILHPSVVNSTLLESSLVKLYNVVYGPQGERSATLFEFLAGLFAITDEYSATIDENFETVLVVFLQVVLRNGSANIHPTLTLIAEVFIDKAVVMSRDPADPDVIKLRQTADKLNRHLNIGRSIADAAPKAAKFQATKARFTAESKPPGGRHDNDHVDIQKIKIMPTLEEIHSSQMEYLPTRNQQNNNLTSFEALVDRQFRLLREDTVGQLRDAIRAALQVADGTKSTHNNSGPRIHVYDHCGIVQVFFSRRSGMEVLIRVDQPNPAKQAKNRKTWWERSKRLLTEALVCITGVEDCNIYCTVTTQGPPKPPAMRKVDQLGEVVQDSKFQKFADLNLYNEADGAYLSVKPVSTDTTDLCSLLSTLVSTNRFSYRMVEFPGVLLPAFQPTLTALQHMLRTDDMPFTDILTAEAGDNVRLSTPAYARNRNFTYDLTCLTSSGQALSYSPHTAFNLDSLVKTSTLDEAQAKALIHCLSSSLALIQGPPGTGKSFTGIALIKVLLAAKKKAKLGPIVCVCFTNHALDQLLEHLHNEGIKQIIRIGSRSKSAVLEDVNLRKVAQAAEMTRTEKRVRWELGQSLDNDVRQIDSLLNQLQETQHISVIKTYLETYHPYHYRQLFSKEEDEDGFQPVRGEDQDELRRWLNGGSPSTKRPLRSMRELEDIDVRTTSQAERQTLYQSWLTDIRKIAIDDTLSVCQSFCDTAREFDQVRAEIDLRCLQEADVVGITTSGLARNLHVLRKLQTKVLVCEEAGEVLEAHILTALLPSLEHAILIGDHEQLRPSVQNYELSRENPRGVKYSLDVSLFERLVRDPSGVQPQIPFCTLDVQRRMHPSISQLIRDTLYPDLKNAPNVSEYPQVIGMKKRLFWLDHARAEDGADHDQPGSVSHSNAFEVQMITSLVSHLVRQGVYEAGEIAVLTPYLSQMFKIRQALSSVMEVTMGDRDLEDAAREGFDIDEISVNNADRATAKAALIQSVRVATIDNFQGEEAKVVIISIVRSNDQDSYGFLRVPNRVNVLLSRAKHGMYIIGNSRVALAVPMWQKVIEILRASDCVGDELELQCSRHPNTSIPVSTPDGFVVLSPEGGCQLLCDQRLLCGHPCRNKCHSVVLHNAVRCIEPCPRSLKGCDHSCPNHCGDACVTRCKVVLRGQILDLACGHRVTNPECWQDQDPTAVLCKEFVQKTVPHCGHTLEVKCPVDVTRDAYICRAKCSEILVCGHACQKLCFQCRPQKEDGVASTADHGSCSKICGRDYQGCKHQCSQICHGEEPCAPCSAPCETACSHSRCIKKCSEPCAPCAFATCASFCPHSRCTMPCAAPCNWLPCGERCLTKLECDHQCPSLCGEVCPTSEYCQVCAADTIKNQCVDYILMSDYRDADLDEDPCIFPGCGHILTVSTMDGMMQMQDFYDMSADGKALSVKAKELDLTLSMPGCPKCRASFRDIHRYGRMIRNDLLVDATKKFINWSNSQYVPLAQAVQTLQENLAQSTNDATKHFATLPPVIVNLVGSQEQQIVSICSLVVSSRYKDLVTAYRKIARYARAVAKEEQPFRRVWDHVQHNRRNQGLNTEGFEFDTGVLQTRQSVLASSLLIRCHLSVLCDFVGQATVVPERSRIDMTDSRKQCEVLATLASSASQPAIEVEAYLYYARYCAAEQSFNNNLVNKLSRDSSISVGVLQVLRETSETRKQEGLARIVQAKVICDNSPGSTVHLTKEVEQVETMVRESSLHDVLRPEEMKAVYDAMAREFGGTGHWYRCENQHLFTVGECGMPMQLARCPQCGAAVGGQSHTAAEGVTHARDLERAMENMRL